VVFYCEYYTEVIIDGCLSDDTGQGKWYCAKFLAVANHFNILTNVGAKRFLETPQSLISDLLIEVIENIATIVGKHFYLY
jgi:hypothetical protein